MRPLVGLLAIALLSAGAGACGRTGTSRSSVAEPPSLPARHPTADTGAFHKGVDGDFDDGYSDHPYDNDNGEIVDLGSAASAADERAVASVLKRYYVAAAAGDGATGCSLSYLSSSVVEDFGRPPGPPALRGTTCAVVMSKIFKQRHAELAAEAATVHVAAVRVKGDVGVALLSYGSSSRAEHYIRVHRNHDAWEVGELFAVPMP
jgi:hypothetical protein